jgi:urea transporter
MLVTVGVLLASRISGIAAIVGAAVGVYGAIALGADPGEIYEGLWGYDSTLACICVGGLFFRLSPRTAVLAVIAAMFATLSHGAWRSFFYPVGLPPLTFGAATTCFLFTSMGKILPRVYVMPLGDVKLPEENF